MCHAFANNGLEVILAIPAETNKARQDNYNEILEKLFGIKKNFLIITFKKISVGNRLSLIGGYWGIKKLLKGIECDLCFTRNSFYASIVIQNKIPVVYESHNYLVHAGSKVLNRFWVKRLIRDARKDLLVGFVAISKALANFWMQQGISPHKIMALHDGVNHRHFQNKLDSNFLRKNMSIPSNQKIVMYIGSLYADRGIETIIDLAGVFPQTRFVVVGGPEQKRIEYEALSLQKNQTNNITFIGRIAHFDVPNYLQCADILLMIWTNKVKTINYCSPLKTFEYMASGRLIVGHGFPTIKEVLEDGKTAFLADPGSFESLKKKLYIALTCKQSRKIGERAQTEAFKKYTWDQRASAILRSINMKDEI